MDISFRCPACRPCPPSANREVREVNIVQIFPTALMHSTQSTDDAVEIRKGSVTCEHHVSTTSEEI